MANPWRRLCDHCGSHNISYPATGWWDEVKQEWELTLDDGAPNYCGDCHEASYDKIVDVTDVKTLALIAIHQKEQSDGS